jgi:hypothetical protein
MVRTEGRGNVGAATSIGMTVELAFQCLREDSTFPVALECNGQETSAIGAK